MKLQDYIAEAKANAEKKKIMDGAISTAEDILDDIQYKAKEYFGGWPDDVVGSQMAKLYYDTLYKELAKRLKRAVHA